MSLKSNLNQIIKDRNGEVFTLNELEAYCHKYPAKLSQVEQRLRECPDIGKEFKKGAIVGYYWKTAQDSAPRQPITDKPISPVAQKFLERNEKEWHPKWDNSDLVEASRLF